MSKIETPEQMHEQYSSYIRKIAKRYSNNSVDFEDLCQEGYVGMYTAAEKFDPKRGVKFLTYASFYIRKFIWRYAKKEGRYSATDKIEQLLTDSTERLPTEQVEVDSYNKQLVQLVVKELRLRSSISRRDLWIISSRLLNQEPKTFKQLAQEHNITNQRVQQIETQYKPLIRQILTDVI